MWYTEEPKPFDRDHNDFETAYIDQRKAEERACIKRLAETLRDKGFTVSYDDNQFTVSLSSRAVTPVDVFQALPVDFMDDFYMLEMFVKRPLVDSRAISIYFKSRL